jgi:hypothetical protein
VVIEFYERYGKTMRTAIVSFFKSTVFKGMLRGMGGAAFAALGFRLASDAYDLVKAKVKDRMAEKS